MVNKVSTTIRFKCRLLWRKYFNGECGRTILPLYIKIRIWLSLFVTFAAIFNIYVYFRQIQRTRSSSYKSLPASVKEFFTKEAYAKSQEYSEARLTLSIYCELGWACFYLVLMFIGLNKSWNLVYFIQTKCKLHKMMAYLAYGSLNYCPIYIFQRTTVIFLNLLEVEYGFLDYYLPPQPKQSQLCFSKHLLFILVTFFYSCERSEPTFPTSHRNKFKALFLKVWFKCFSLTFYTFIYSRIYLHLDIAELSWENEVNGPYTFHSSYLLPDEIADDLQTEAAYLGISSVEFYVRNISTMTKHSTLRMLSRGTQMLISDTSVAGIISNNSQKGIHGMLELKAVVLNQFAHILLDHSGEQLAYIFRLFSVAMSLIAILACVSAHKTTSNNLIFWKVLGFSETIPKPNLALALVVVNILGIVFARLLHPNWTTNSYMQAATLEADEFVIKRGFGLILRSTIIKDAVDNLVFPSEDAWYNRLHHYSPDLLTRIAGINLFIQKHNASSQCFRDLLK